jgi:hypothetical protein
MVPDGKIIGIFYYSIPNTSQEEIHNKHTKLTCHSIYNPSNWITGKWLGKFTLSYAIMVSGQRANIAQCRKDTPLRVLWILSKQGVNWIALNVWKGFKCTATMLALPPLFCSVGFASSGS